MKSIGEHLRTAREEKGYSFDQVVHDTNISKEYISALEGDDFDFFPAEAYLIGFLRNYSEYLGLEPAKMVGIYKNFKISEEPVPMDLLFGKKKPAPEKKEDTETKRETYRPRWIAPLVIILIILAAGASLFFFTPLLKAGKKQVVTGGMPLKEGVKTASKDFFLTDDTLDITVTSGDKINVSTGSSVASFDVILNDTEQVISYTDKDGSPARMALVEGGEQVILLNDTQGVYFFVKKVSPGSATLVAQKVKVDNSQIGADGKGTIASGAAANALQTSAGNSDRTVIMTETYPKAYEVDAQFRGDTLFRYDADGQGRTERFYQSGERLKIDVSRNVLIWASNAGNVELKISGQAISIGGNGEVVVRSIKWVKNNESGKYELVIVPYS